MLVRILSTALLVTSIASAAEAALWSPPLHGGLGTHLTCRVMNLASTARSVTIQVADGYGKVLANTAVSLQPGHSVSATTAKNDTGYCWVLGIGKKESRITFSVERDDDFSTLTAVQIR